jgi:allantoicase
MSTFLDLPDLACARFGGEVLTANDDFFAPKENLVLDAAPVWDAERYTDRGKWMDGWETRRRREEGHDWCVVRLGLPGIPQGVEVDTSHFRGNYPESCSLEACALPAGAAVDDVLAPTTEWLEILPRTPLQGDTRNRFLIDVPFRFTHLRFHIYPDGGVARLRVHGEVVPGIDTLLAKDPLNLLALELGARVLGASDRFFSSPENLLRAGDPIGMHDGWETRRRRGPGNDWAVFRLVAPGMPSQAEVDTTFFKGNAPGSCALEVLSLPPGEDARALAAGTGWQPLLQRTPLEPDRRHVFVGLERPAEAVTHLRLRTFPDGGVARLRLPGHLDRSALPDLALGQLNSLPPVVARERFLDCLAVDSWARAMAARRPFADPAALAATAEREADRLGAADWRRAFEAHPPIGGDRAERPRGEVAARWSSAEQAGVEASGGAVREQLAAANERYKERFGFGFIVCASGKSGSEMLALLEERLGNDPLVEFALATEEERKIMRLRLERLVSA